MRNNAGCDSCSLRVPNTKESRTSLARISGKEGRGVVGGEGETEDKREMGRDVEEVVGLGLI
jgi:hypothetical protein